MSDPNIDASLMNADWPKAWGTLPPYKSPEFMAFLEFSGMTLEGFKQLPVYARAVQDGLIVNDEWSGRL